MEESRLEVPNEDLIEKMQTIANHSTCTSIGILKEKTMLLSLRRKTVGKKLRCCFKVVLPLDNGSTQKR